MVEVFHEVQSDDVEAVLLRGLTLGSGGDKRNADIVKTDKFLNQFCPRSLRDGGVNRETNVYCYLSVDGAVLDIVSGEKRSPVEVKSPGQTLLRVMVDPHASYVSDLDLYDKIMELLKNSNESEANQLAQNYWRKVQLLTEYRGGIRRPEVLVTYDIPPTSISKFA